MQDKLSKIKQKALTKINQAKNLADLNKVKTEYLGRKGELASALKDIKKMPKNKRPKVGKLINEIKERLEKEIKQKIKKFETDKSKNITKTEWIDVTRPGIRPSLGHLHPITQTQKEVENIFKRMGFEVIEGPEIETDYYNFEALNIPKDHPARDLMDTFWLKTINGKSQIANRNNNQQSVINNKLLLRTHTSPMQVRIMEKRKPPLRIIVPGRCFRHEATDASHETTFHQIEGLMVAKDVSLANLKGIFKEFLTRFFGPKTKSRLRPGYFPFVEPGFELDVSCVICKGKGCSVCKNTGWVEIIPCGMVHPNVLKNVGYDPNKIQGFAFGMGLDRVAMMKYGIDDIRLFYSGGLKFLNQF